MPLTAGPIVSDSNGNQQTLKQFDNADIGPVVQDINSNDLAEEVRQLRADLRHYFQILLSILDNDNFLGEGE
jgi:hypothetical protein